MYCPCSHDLFKNFSSKESLFEMNISPPPLYMYIYTEHQKKHHFFRAMLNKIHHMKINQIWTLVSYSTPDEAHLKNQKVAFVKNKKDAVTSQKVFFFCKSQKLITENLHERPPIQNIQQLFIHFEW